MSPFDDLEQARKQASEDGVEVFLYGGTIFPTDGLWVRRLPESEVPGGEAAIDRLDIQIYELGSSATLGVRVAATVAFQQASAEAQFVRIGSAGKWNLNGDLDTEQLLTVALSELATLYDDFETLGFNREAIEEQSRLVRAGGVPLTRVMLRVMP